MSRSEGGLKEWAGGQLPPAHSFVAGYLNCIGMTMYS